VCCCTVPHCPKQFLCTGCSRKYTGRQYTGVCRICYGKRHNCHPTNSTTRSKRKNYDDLAPRERFKRRKLGKTALEEIGIPAIELVPTPPPSQFIHLSTSQRNTIRKSLPLYPFPSERLFVKKKTHFHSPMVLQHPRLLYHHLFK
jgi:hypothetical protein